MGLARVDGAGVRGRAIRITSERLRFDLGRSSSGVVFGGGKGHEDRDRRRESSQRTGCVCLKRREYGSSILYFTGLQMGPCSGNGRSFLEAVSIGSVFGGIGGEAGRTDPVCVHRSGLVARRTLDVLRRQCRERVSPLAAAISGWGCRASHLWSNGRTRNRSGAGRKVAGHLRWFSTKHSLGPHSQG